MRWLCCVMITATLFTAACIGSGSSNDTSGAATTAAFATVPAGPDGAVATELPTQPVANLTTPTTVVSTQVAQQSATSVATPSPPGASPGPTEQSAAERYAELGYNVFDRTELALMVHPRLVEEPVESSADAAGYAFVDPNSLYLRMDIWVFKTVGPMSEVPDEFIRETIDGIIDSSPHILEYKIIDSQPTSIGGRPGRIARFNYVSNGESSYAAMLMFSYGSWLYRFNVYGADAEYPVVEDIVASIFGTAFLRGPS